MAPGGKLAAVAAGILAVALAAELRGAEEEAPVIEATLAAGDGIQQVDLYRAMKGESAGVYTEENNDLASLGGVLKYLMTEILGESWQDQTRQTRKYGIDSVATRRYKIKAIPQTVPACQELIPGFHRFATFDQGQSTNADLDPIFTQCGDMVGYQSADVPQWAHPMQDPPFWFSVSGFCPNLPFQKLPITDATTKQTTTTARCTNELLCEAKGSKAEPDAKCLKYGGDTGTQALQGGLCTGADMPDSTVPTMDPTGEQGCVYTYGKHKLIDLDTISGIKDQNCTGGVKCKDWLDFRKNCADPTLRKMFNSVTGAVVDAKTPDHTSFCTEYDVHPKCRGAGNCTNQECKDLKQDSEIGLPFWKGICDPKANQRRLEAMAAVVGIEGAQTRHQLVNQDILDLQTTCSPSTNAQCRVSLGGTSLSVGGPYCSRAFAGICYVCRIRNVKGGVLDVSKPRCPFDVLRLNDYKDVGQPECNSKKASDECCLYASEPSCDGLTKDPWQAPLDMDGLAMMVYYSWNLTDNATRMKYFMQRVAGGANYDIDLDKTEVNDFAYRAWDSAFTWADQGGYAAFVEGVKALGTAKATVTMTATITTTTAAPGTDPSAAGAAGMPAWAWVLIILGILIAVGALGYVFMGGRGGGGGSDNARGVEMHS